MPTHLHDDRVHENHFKIDGNGKLISSGYHDLQYINTGTNTALSGSSLPRELAIDTGTGTGDFSLTLPDPSDVPENGVVKEVRVANLSDFLSSSGNSDNDIVVSISGGGSFFQGLSTIRIKPNKSITFAVYKDVVNSQTVAAWSVRSRVEYITSADLTSSVNTDSTDINLSITSTDFTGLITQSSGDLTFNFNGQVEVTTQFRVDPQNTDGTYSNVSCQDTLNGVLINGTTKNHALKQELGNFIQGSNERYLFDVKVGDVFSSSTNGGFTSSATLLNYRVKIKSYI
ncbi:hypothetical protein [Phaeobacter italicus]|jgi:hypothetical protein|uniref:hypothetical protein n=1 Tax=Phaeobacter italicus TaxID=481446 RepID=UPI002FDDE8DB